MNITVNFSRCSIKYKYGKKSRKSKKLFFNDKDLSYFIFLYYQGRIMGNFPNTVTSHNDYNCWSYLLLSSYQEVKISALITTYYKWRLFFKFISSLHARQLLTGIKLHVVAVIFYPLQSRLAYSVMCTQHNFTNNTTECKER